MRRFKMSPSKSRSSFTRAAMRTPKINYRVGVQRGGIRL